MKLATDEPIPQDQSPRCTGVCASWSVGGLLQTLAQREHHPAVVAFNDAGVETWDCRTLADHARRLAHGLRQSGIDRGTAVALWAPNSPVWIVCALAILAAGGILVPVDDLAEPDAFTTALKSSNARLVITTWRHLEASGSYWCAQGIRAVLIDEIHQFSPNVTRWRTVLRESNENLPDASGDEPALLSWTWGTTGTPKAFVLSHRNIATNVDGQFGGPRLIASLLREHHLAQKVIAQYQAGPQQRVGG